jgi:hypothetical protein
MRNAPEMKKPVRAGGISGGVRLTVTSSNGLTRNRPPPGLETDRTGRSCSTEGVFNPRIEALGVQSAVRYAFRVRNDRTGRRHVNDLSGD